MEYCIRSHAMCRLSSTPIDPGICIDCIANIQYRTDNNLKGIQTGSTEKQREAERTMQKMMENAE